MSKTFYHQLQMAKLPDAGANYHTTKWHSSWLTPFLPGMPHSQFIKFNVPSTALVGRATNPCK